MTAIMRESAKNWKFVGLGLLFAGTVSAAPPDWLADRAELLFQRVYAQPTTECPSGLDGIGTREIGKVGGWNRAQAGVPWLH